ncbi:IPT/TIG domain-containing protein [Chitinophaga dinghuensis]|uniref:IPT/TIG domain-containing protein n=1 Tax=Chitinophaga dinghuensis TaxID=1539050 RepID=A0A327VNH7_9BACT|nr:IPT/TIG domain-containing protein [Chitinophaga dinghuensis]RAJ76643.1 IPT/TIG domain-containing protein [Chitinophaga dinghuensis]
MKKILTYLCSLLLIVSIGLLEACRKNDSPVARPLAISSYYPNSGNAGTLVTVLGTGLVAKGKIMFGDKEGEILNSNDTSLVVRAPENGTTGKLTFITTDKTIEIGTYTYQSLSVHSFFPMNGSVGMQIRIAGEGFGSTSAPAEVTINGIKAVVVSVSDTLIVAEIPEKASSGAVTVKVNGKTSSGPNFRFQSVTGIKPLTGGVGTKVTVTGEGFEGTVAGNIVDFNGKAAKVLEVGPTKLVVEAPADVATGPVAVTINGQKTVGPVFTIVPLPVIAAVTPLSGPKGLDMTISGANFSAILDENVVMINGVVIPVKTATASKLTLTLPGGTGDGKVVLAVNDQKVEGPQFKDQNLGITMVNPATGLAGTKVTITGAGFSTVASENIVTFNGVPAVVESATETSIVVTTPASLTSGQLVVKRAALEAQAPNEFLRAGVQTLYGGPGTGSVINYATTSIAVDSKGNVYLSNRQDATIRKITPDGKVDIWAGKAGTFGNKNGTLADATFGSINSIVIDANDNMYVSEASSANAIRKIASDGSVTTLKTGLGYAGQLFLNKAGEVYITQSYSGILKVYATGATEKPFGGSVGDACRPTIDAAGNIYFLNDDYNPYLSRIIGTGGMDYQYIGQSSDGYQDGPRLSAKFGPGIVGTLLDLEGNLLILDKWNYSIRKYNFSNGEVTTMMKAAGGFQDGAFDQAKFSVNVSGFTIAKDGSIYVLDMNNSAVRKIFLR